jgi:hypothetical protein
VETLKINDGQHHAIIDAIEAGDADRAHAAMQAHLSTLVQNLKQTGFTDDPLPAPPPRTSPLPAQMPANRRRAKATTNGSQV